MKTKELTQNSRFLNKTFHKALVPSILSMLGGNITILADGMIVGQKLGDPGLSSINLCMPIYLLICVFGSWMVSGTAIPASKAMGAGDNEEGNRYCHQSQFLCLVVSILLTILGFIFLNPIVNFLCSDEALQPMVKTYTWTIIASVIPKIMIYIPFWYLRLDGKNNTITIMMLIMSAGNILLDILFMYGLELGIFGAGIASLIANLVATVYGFWSLFHDKKNFTLGLSKPKNAKELKTITITGMPPAFNNLFQSFRVLTINLILMHTFGSSMVAIFTVINGVSSFTESVLFGVPQAASAMMGSFAGDKDYSSIKLVLKQQLQYGFSLCVLASAIIVAGSSLIGALYGIDAELSFPLLCLGLSLFPAIISTVLISYYNTIGYENSATIFVILRVFLIPTLVLFGLIKLNLPIYYFMPVGEVIAIILWGIIFISRYSKDKSRTKLLRLPIKLKDPILCCSVEGNSEEICTLSEGVLQFCEEHDMDTRKSMRLSLAAEELLVLIAEENKGEHLFCDLRLRINDELATMTLRYSGKEFTPLTKATQDEDEYMGVRMLVKLMKSMEYQNISGMNILRISI